MILDELEKRRIYLNPQQRQAVLDDSARLLLLAVPGSGKTTVMVSRIARLIGEKGISPSSIPVSYTHLDVSKRQFIHRVILKKSPVHLPLFSWHCFKPHRRLFIQIHFSASHIFLDDAVLPFKPPLLEFFSNPDC